MSKKTKKILCWFKNIFLVILFVCSALLIVKNTMYEEVIVSGHSMERTLLSGDYGLTETTSFAKNNLSRFKIITFQYEDKLLIKRVIGMPFEKLRIDPNNGDLYINDNLIEQNFLTETDKCSTCSKYSEKNFCLDEGITLGEDEFFVMGDNREVSLDSRSLVGTVKRDQIKGVLKFIYGHCTFDETSSTCQSGTRKPTEWRFF